MEGEVVTSIDAPAPVEATIGVKRAAEEEAEPSHARPRIGYGKESHPHKPAEQRIEVRADGVESKTIAPTQAPKDALKDQYLDVVAAMVYPRHIVPPFGPASKLKLPLDRLSSLGYLISPLRPTTVFERWSPLEIATFESTMMLFGKNFNMIQKYVRSKTVQEVIEFYYDWKKSSHYEVWKKTYVPDERDFA